jgi:hypothetical protein
MPRAWPARITFAAPEGEGKKTAVRAGRPRPRQISLQGGDLSPKVSWESEVQKEEELKPATRLPSNDQVSEILQAIITHVLTDPDLKSTREFHGTRKDRTLALVDADKLGWPEGFKPKTAGYRHVEVRHVRFVNQNRILGLRLDKFDLGQKKADLLDTPIQVCLFNVGGSGNGDVIGGCLVYYMPKPVGKHWTVECTGWVDP